MLVYQRVCGYIAVMIPSRTSGRSNFCEGVTVFVDPHVGSPPAMNPGKRGQLSVRRWGWLKEVRDSWRFAFHMIALGWCDKLGQVTHIVRSDDL